MRPPFPLDCVTVQSGAVSQSRTTAPKKYAEQCEDESCSLQLCRDIPYFKGPENISGMRTSSSHDDLSLRL